MLGHTHRKGVPHLTLVLPDGTRSLIPASWTDIKGQVEHGPRAVTNDGRSTSLRDVKGGSSTLLGSVFDLLKARKVVDALLDRLERCEPIDEPSPKKESKRATSTGVLDHGGTPSSSAVPAIGSRCGATRGTDHPTGPDDQQGSVSAVDPVR